MKTEILKKLRETTGYLSGQELCEEFQVSRTAIWKVISKLKEEGYEIEAVRNKGYCMKEAPDSIGADEVESLLKTEWAGRKVVYYHQVGSTNDEAKHLAEQGAKHGTLVIAETQQSGKGRRGKHWESKAGDGIFMSLILRPNMEPKVAPMLTLVMGLSIAEALRKTEEVHVRIKWPNDIVLQRKKLCGVLTEMSAEIDYINHVVIGVGINVHTKEFSGELEKIATSIWLEMKEEKKRASIIVSIMERFEYNYQLFEKSGNLALIKDKYNQLLINVDREVRILEQQGSHYEGVAIGINEAGELIVKQKDGKERAVYAGEVSVRGLYDYI